MKLPFGKKSSTPQKSSAPKKKRGGGGVPHSAIAQPRRQGNHWANEWEHPAAPEGLPGICGYLNGVQKPEAGDHPSRFVYVRPDGQPETKTMAAEKTEGSVPSRASTRPVPRGFFGP